MREIWFSSDPHRGHANILNFTDEAGIKIRGSRFTSIAEHDECILQRHNEWVKPGDIWYCVGDLTFKNNEEHASWFSKLNGKKRLIVGNHDPIKEIAPHFEKVLAWRVFNNAGDVPFTVSHFPLHPLSFKGKFNVHGHTHQHLVKIEGTVAELPDPRYINICMEHTDYYPVSYDELQDRMKRRLDPQDDFDLYA